jgi:hypothetical protein
LGGLVIAIFTIHFWKNFENFEMAKIEILKIFPNFRHYSENIDFSHVATHILSHNLGQAAAVTWSIVAGNATLSRVSYK